MISLRMGKNIADVIELNDLIVSMIKRSTYNKKSHFLNLIQGCA
jgi:hypothetical protein